MSDYDAGFTAGARAAMDLVAHNLRRREAEYRASALRVARIDEVRAGEIHDIADVYGRLAEDVKAGRMSAA